MEKQGNKKRGFTLVELSVVMAIAAIVGVMITTTLMISQKQTGDLKTGSKKIANISTVQAALDDYIMQYDSAAYQIKPSADKKTLYTYNRHVDLESANETVTVDSSPCASLSFSEADRKLVWSENGSEKNSYTLKNIDKIDVSFTDNMVILEVFYGGEGESVKIMHATFSNVKKDRYLSDDRKSK